MGSGWKARHTQGGGDGRGEEREDEARPASPTTFALGTTLTAPLSPRVVVDPAESCASNPQRRLEPATRPPRGVAARFAPRLAASLSPHLDLAPSTVDLGRGVLWRCTCVFRGQGHARALRISLVVLVPPLSFLLCLVELMRTLVALVALVRGRDSLSAIHTDIFSDCASSGLQRDVPSCSARRKAFCRSTLPVSRRPRRPESRSSRRGRLKEYDSTRERPFEREGSSSGSTRRLGPSSRRRSPRPSPPQSLLSRRPSGRTSTTRARTRCGSVGASARRQVALSLVRSSRGGGTTTTATAFSS